MTFVTHRAAGEVTHRAAGEVIHRAASEVPKNFIPVRFVGTNIVRRLLLYLVMRKF